MCWRLERHGFGRWAEGSDTEFCHFGFLRRNPYLRTAIEVGSPAPFHRWT